MEEPTETITLISRPYQAQLEEIAMKNNTIIYLPTGTGKTFIAAQLIKNFGQALKKPWGQGGKRTFFLVNNVPLVTQQRKVIKDMCPVKVGQYSSEDGVDYWDKAKWVQELEEHQVIVMTSQILCDMLTHQYISIQDINLIIFDECHHAVEDHPMRIVMKHFEDCPVHKQPRVVGLTATLLNANVSSAKVEQTLHDLEKTFHASIATANELGEVLEFSTNPKEILLNYTSPTLSDTMVTVIAKLRKLETVIIAVKLPLVAGKHDIKLKPWQQDITTDPKKIVKLVKNMVSAMIRFIEELGMYGGALGILSYMVVLERLRRRASTKEEAMLYKLTITQITEARAMLLNAMSDQTGYAKIEKYSSQKVLLLLNTLKEYNPEVMKKPGVLLKVNHSRNAISSIIFTKERFTAKILFNLLKDVIQANPSEFGFLKHDFIVGFNVNPYKNTREDHYLKKSSQKALLKFKNGHLNCLIATSVIEEGVDIQQCVLVIRYDRPLEYRSYIQSKGRARSSEASYVMLIDAKESQSFIKKYQEFQRIEHLIQKILTDNSDQRDTPGINEIKKGLYEDDDVPPYITANGHRLTSTSAISLLNRYCSTLPHDQFTIITPMWIQEKVTVKSDILRRITIFLPITCPIKEPLLGMPLHNIKAAKRSAALNACVKLYEHGELDSETLLPVKYTNVDFDNEDVKKCFQNWPQNDEDEETPDIPKAGTKRRMRKYKIEFPSFLDYVEGQSQYYLHIIKLKTAFAKPKASRENALYDLLQMGEGYGFLTQKQLPALCDFPMFMTVGEIETSIEVNYAVINLNAKLFNLVKQYHYFVFDQVLSIAKKFLVFEGKVNCMYVVPVKYDDGYDIDWNIMIKHNSIEPVAPPPVKDRCALRVTEENYKHRVLSPWYRETILPDRYIVSNILEHMTQFSTLDHMNSTTFADYYADKYKLQTVGDKHQPLLEVVCINTGMNCLLPRASTINTFSDKQRKLVAISQGDDKASRKFDEKLVAEYCIKYDYPGVLWYKALLLPSIIHRLHMLLTAYELLSKINKDIGYVNIKDVSENITDEESMNNENAEEVIQDYNKEKYEDFEGLQMVSRKRRSVSPQTSSFNEMKRPKEDFDRISILEDSTGRAIEATEILVQALQKEMVMVKLQTEGGKWKRIETDIHVAKQSLLSQVEQPASINAIDRINNPIDELAPKPRNIMSMKESLYQLQQQKINKEYAWDVKLEPIDIERNLSTVTLMDLECYDEFVTAPLVSVNHLEGLCSPPRVVPDSPAISAPPIKYMDKIKLLQMKPTNVGPELKDVIAALTTIKSHDNFNLERAETLGDSFLKFAATLYLYHKFPKWNEGQLTNIKCRLISNRNLYYAAANFNLGGRMKVEHFAPRKDFLVPGFFAPPEVEQLIVNHKIHATFQIGMHFSPEEALTGRLEPASKKMVNDRFKETDNAEKESPGGAQNAMQCYVHRQAVSDKSVADCVEALIGTYLLSGGIVAAIKIVEWMKVIPPQDNFESFLKRRVPTVISQGLATEKDIDFSLNHYREEVEEILGYKFRDPSFLLEALSHPSYIRNRLTGSYERLEFLGDAILDFLITSHIFKNSTDLKPGDITDLRSALVNNVTFASYVVKLGLHKFLCSELSPALDKAILRFLEHQEQREHEIIEDVLYLIDEEECQIAEYIEVPKVLSDIFEALVGAMYLDNGGDLQKIWAIVYRIMCQEIHSFSARIPKQPVRVLYENIHACPVFGATKVIDPDIPKIMVPVTITKRGQQHTVYGVGKNKSQAKRAAAKMALKLLNI